MSLPACCTDLDIYVMDLIFPNRLPPAGREFFDAHGLGKLTVTERDALLAGGVDMGAGVVKIKHRCAQLQDDGRCGIYVYRPTICRDFDCGKRYDCACGGAGFIPTGGILLEPFSSDRPNTVESVS